MVGSRGHRGFRLHVLALAVTWWVGATGLPSAAVETSTLRVKLENGMVAALTSGRQLYLEAEPLRGEGFLGFARRLCGTSEVADLVAAANGGSRRLLTGVRYRVPFDLLGGDFQLMVVKALFEEDRADASGWLHRIQVLNGQPTASLWHVADWFTGRGENYRAILDSNSMVDDDLTPGQVLLIPARLLRPAFRSALPASSPYHLEYGSDNRGEFAVYRIKSGEAIYSSVVVRFTGRIFAEDVNALAASVAERSGIRDVTDIPIDYQIKIPFDVLLPEYLPRGHQRRQEYEEKLLTTARYSNQVQATQLQGVTVVLDAGHGGKDVGASVSGVWESIYVYDIMARTKILLERTTAAKVLATTQDGGAYTVLDRDHLPYSRNHRVLTTPNYAIEDSTVGVHLRWYLANSIYRQAIGNGTDPARVIFISIHGDSLHPALRGAMVYIPGSEYRSGSYGKTGSIYAARSEVRERQSVSYSSRERHESEGLSRDLAGHILDAFAAAGLTVHPDKPIREKVIRGRRPYVPAILRYNAIPAKVLLEVCNLANSPDRDRLQSREFRHQVSEALVRGILSYYGQAEETGQLQVAAAAR